METFAGQQQQEGHGRCPGKLDVLPTAAKGISHDDSQSGFAHNSMTGRSATPGRPSIPHGDETGVTVHLRFSGDRRVRKTTINTAAASPQVPFFTLSHQRRQCGGWVIKNASPGIPLLYRRPPLNKAQQDAPLWAVSSNHNGDWKPPPKTLPWKSSAPRPAARCMCYGPPVVVGGGSDLVQLPHTAEQRASELCREPVIEPEGNRCPSSPSPAAMQTAEPAGNCREYGEDPATRRPAHCDYRCLGDGSEKIAPATKKW